MEDQNDEAPTPVTLLIKAANSRCGDLTVNCDLKWSIRRLKIYISDQHPIKPNAETIRLIYFGKLLVDTMVLKDFLRQSNEITIHTIHMVSKQLNDDFTAQTNAHRANANNSGGSNRPTANIQSANNVSFSQLPNLTPKEQYTQIYSQLQRQYQLMGMPTNNPWNSTYLQHTALYYQMYGKYMQSLGLNPVTTQQANLAANVEQTTPDRAQDQAQQQGQQQQPQAQAQQQQQQQNEAQLNDADNRNEDREDDWLSLLHNFCSFLILFSIIYFYTSFTRFVLVFGAVLLLVLYHGGWFNLERRQVRNANENNNNNNNNRPNENNGAQAGAGDGAAAAAAGDGENVRQNDNNNQEQVNTEPAVVNQSVISLIFSFIITFFTSLIPDRHAGRVGN